MHKYARKPSSDSIQEALREHKAIWNKHVSKFLSTLIALKNAMNGRPVSALGVEKGNIKDPLPPIIPQLLDHLASEYEALTQEGKSIVNEQANYSKTRQKGKEVIASNPLSRFWAYTKLPFQSDPHKWSRKNLLQATVDLEHIITQIEDAILSRKSNTIPLAIYLTKDFTYKFEHDVLREFLNLKKQLKLKEETKELPQSSEQEAEQFTPEESVDLIARVENMNKDVRKWANKVVKMRASIATLPQDQQNEINELLQGLSSLMVDFLRAVKERASVEYLENLYKQIAELYQNVENFMNLPKTSNLDNQELEIFAANVVTRTLRQKYLSWWRTRESTLRLSASKVLYEIIKIFDKLQSDFEKPGIDLAAFENKLIKALKHMMSFIDWLVQLGEMHNSQAKIDRMENRKSKKRQGVEIVAVKDLSDLVRVRRKYEELIGALSA